jgi:hypothetical protein
VEDWWSRLIKVLLLGSKVDERTCSVIHRDRTSYMVWRHDFRKMLLYDSIRMLRTQQAATPTTVHVSPVDQ